MQIGDIPKQFMADAETAGFINVVRMVVASLIAAGTSAGRPVKNLWVGRAYWDSTVGHPIYWDGTQWVDALGNVVP